MYGGIASITDAIRRPPGHLSVGEVAALAERTPVEVWRAARSFTLLAEPGEVLGWWWILPADALAWAGRTAGL